MKIEERALTYARAYYGIGKDAAISKKSYEAGAVSQRKIDIAKACEWFSEHIIEYVDYVEMDGWNVRHREMHEDFRKAMEE